MNASHRTVTVDEDISRVRLSADPLPDVLLALCELADSPRSLAVWLMYKHGSHEQLVSLEMVNSNYSEKTAYQFALDYLVTSILSKFSDFDLGIDREEVAFKKWLASEERCARVNEVFRNRWSGKNDIAPDTGLPAIPDRVEQVIHLARLKIREMLKDVDYEYIRSHCKFGPGSDLSTRGDNTTSYHKFGSDGACTPWIVPLYDDIFSNEESDFRGEFPHRARLCGESRLSFVPKNAKTDRAICVEPRWNVYLQLGIGALIDKRLRRYGLDSRHQEPNQLLAKRALDDGLATIDLSSASDSVATNLVIDMVENEEWLDLLLKARCPATLYKGKRFRLEKISSMGNGYTFPLETALFYAISFGAMVVSGDASRVGHDCRVYGDDIIVPKTSAPLLLESLEVLGFLPNRSKTFLEGNFYESCGKDFFKGIDVRPFFIKKKVTTVLDAFTLANQISAYAESLAGRPDFALRKVWNIREHVIRRIPRHLRCFGPPEAGSGVIHAAFDIARPLAASQTFERRGWEGWIVKAHVPRPTKKLGWNTQGHLFSKLSSDIDTGQTFNTRHDVQWRLRRVYVPTYTDKTLI